MVTLNCWKSRTLRVTTVSPLTMAVAAIMASTEICNDFRCIVLAHNRKGDVPIGTIIYVEMMSSS